MLNTIPDPGEPGNCTATPLQSPYSANSTGEQGVAAQAVPSEPLPLLPAELRARAQWAVADPDKHPLTASGTSASSTNPSTWCDFETAYYAALRMGESYGVGFMLSVDDPYSCIDIDVKDTTTPEQMARFKTIYEAFGSYTEFSRSGKGLHVWVQGKIGKGKRRDGVEVYSQDRFMICTGNVCGELRPIRPQYQLLDILVAELNRGQSVEVELEDIDDGIPYWEIALQAFEPDGCTLKNNELGRLFCGDFKSRYQSQSEADLALVKMLARHSESNRSVWEAFRLSALGQREKAQRLDYMRRTLTMARTHLANDAIHQAHGKEIADAIFWKAGIQPTANLPILFTEGCLTAKPLGVFLNEFQAIDFVVDDMIRLGWLYTLTGMTGAGKTAIAVTMALCIASGYSIGQHETKKSRVLYIAGENPDDVRGRFKAALARVKWSEDVINDIHIIDQSFLLDDRIAELETLIDQIEPGVIFVDTDQAVSLSGAEDENNNGVRMKHAKNLRRLTRRQSRSTVVDLCHPVKSAQPGSNSDLLVPRGGAALLNEVDGNLRCFREGDIATLASDPNKFRGSAFELFFSKEEIIVPELTDAKGRQIALPVFLPTNDTAVMIVESDKISAQHQLLEIIDMYPDRSQVAWGELIGWRNRSGEVDKPKVSKTIKAMKDRSPPWLTQSNMITPAGKKELKRLP